MYHELNRFELWFMKRIIKRQVRQGWYHRECVINLYNMIYDAVYNEFTEDNRPTRIAFLTECFDRSNRGL